VFTLIAVTFVPGADTRRRLATFGSRLPFLLTATRVDVIGVERLPTGHAVVVANHASYVDGLLLKGYLPWRYSFVIKGEMRNVPILHFLLRRSGSRFVDRFESAASARDARTIVKAAKDGESLAFFPEGTFRVHPGIGRFRPGAFVAAVRGQMPVVPVAISGSRHMLTCDDWMLRRSRLRIEILDPIDDGDPSFMNHRTLAETARQRILAVLDEPDLVATGNDN
jgi:1-acyl-sn-glycerol-3-phosphate acyltransferase